MQSVTHWCVITPKVLDHRVNEAVKFSSYRTKSELIRNAVRTELERLGFLPQLFEVKGIPPDFLTSGETEESMKVKENERSDHS